MSIPGQKLGSHRLERSAKNGQENGSEDELERERQRKEAEARR